MKEREGSHRFGKEKKRKRKLLWEPTQLPTTPSAETTAGGHALRQWRQHRRQGLTRQRVALQLRHRSPRCALVRKDHRRSFRRTSRAIVVTAASE